MMLRGLRCAPRAIEATRRAGAQLPSRVVPTLLHPASWAASHFAAPSSMALASRAVRLFVTTAGRRNVAVPGQGGRLLAAGRDTVSGAARKSSPRRVLSMSSRPVLARSPPRPPPGTIAKEQPPLLVRAALVGTVTGLATPVYAIMALWRAIYHFVPEPTLRYALFGGASALASYLTWTLLPEIYKHGDLVAPIAISNMIAASAIYLGLDLALGGPQALLLWKGWRFLPVVGAAIGAATGLVAPFLYLPIAEWFYEMKIPRDLIWFWNDVTFDCLALSVFVPVGALAGATLQPVLHHATVGISGVPWAAFSMPFLAASSALFYYIYFTEVVEHEKEYVVLPAELVPPETSAIFRVAPDCSAVGSTVLETSPTGHHTIIPRSGEFVSDGGELAKQGVAARTALAEYLADARDNGVTVFESRGQIKLQRAIDRFGFETRVGNAAVSFSPLNKQNQKALAAEQARTLKSDAVRCVISQTSSEGTTGRSEQRKWDAMEKAAKQVAHDFPAVLESAQWSKSDLAQREVCIDAYNTCALIDSSPARIGEPLSLLQLTQVVIVADGLRKAGFLQRSDLWEACTSAEVRNEQLGESSIGHFFATFGTHTLPVGSFLKIAAKSTRTDEVHALMEEVQFGAGKRDFYEYARRNGTAEDLGTLIRVGTQVSSALAILGVYIYFQSAQ